MRRILATSLFSLLLTASGCMLDGTSSTQNAAEGDDVDGESGGGDRDDCEIEGGASGRGGASVTVGDTTVVFEGWVQKDGEPGEFVGFDLNVDGIPYKVKTGGEVWADSSAEWRHPNGTGGPEVPGISNVDFCDEDGGGGGDGDGGDGGEPTDDCTDPDGCDGEGGDPTDPPVIE